MIEISLNLLHVTRTFAQADRQPTPTHCPIQADIGTMTIALPHQAEPTKCLPDRGQQLAALATLANPDMVGI